MKRSVASWLLAAALAGAHPCAAAAPDGDGLEAAVNKAGRQRMLSQRIVKAYCQIGLDVAAGASRTQLREAIALFEMQLRQLRRSAPNAATRAAIAELERSWRGFKATAIAPTSRDGARKLHRQDEDVLRAADRVTGLFEAASAGTTSRLVNIAGRQRMLSQRLAKLYMLRSWGVDSPNVDAEIALARAEFTAALETLRDARENTPEIGRELAAVALQWEWFDNALTLEGAYTYTLIVADASESILNGMDRVTRRYEELARR